MTKDANKQNLPEKNVESRESDLLTIDEAEKRIAELLSDNEKEARNWDGLRGYQSLMNKKHREIQELERQLLEEEKKNPKVARNLVDSFNGRLNNIIKRRAEDISYSMPWIDKEYKRLDNGEYENIIDNQTLMDVCNMIKEKGFYLNLIGSDFRRFFASLSEEQRDKLVEAIIEGGLLFTYPYVDSWGGLKDYLPLIIENIGLTEGFPIGIRLNNDKESVNLGKKILKAIQDSGGFNHSGVRFDTSKCWFGIYRELEKAAIELCQLYANDSEKCNGFIEIYTGSGWREISPAQMRHEEAKKKEKEAMKNRPELKLDNYQGLDVTDENIQKVIDAEGKKLKDTIVYDYFDFKNVGKENVVGEVVNHFMGTLDLELRHHKKDITLEMVGGAVLGIGNKILEVYKHPYHLNQQPRNPDLIFNKILVSEDGLEVEIEYKTGESGRWTDYGKQDYPNFSVETYLIGKNGEMQQTKLHTYNMYDKLYK